MDYSSYCSHCHDILTNPTVCCTCCTKYYHLRCSPINEKDKNEWSSWTCSECVSIFPYHDIDDDGLVEDMKCNFRSTTVSNLMHFQSRIHLKVPRYNPCSAQKDQEKSGLISSKMYRILKLQLHREDVTPVKVPSTV